MVKTNYPIQNVLQFKMVSMHSEKPICAPPRLSEVSSNVALQTFVWLAAAVSWSFKEDHRARLGEMRRKMPTKQSQKNSRDIYM